MNDLATTPTPVPHRDRSGGLIAMGILLVLIGLACALLAGLMVVSMHIASRSPEMAQMTRGQMYAPVFIYLGLTTFFLWTGIGSMMARRWARAVVLSTSILWLAMGVLAMVMVAFVAPTGGRAWVEGMPAEARAPLVIGLIVAGVFMFIIYVVVPLALTLFFRSPHVKATCELRDPHPRWTDRCPMPVLLAVVGMAAGGLNMATSFGYQVMPMFGHYVTGLAAQAGLFASGALCIVTAVLLYRLRSAGWWLMAAQVLLWGLSGIITFQLGDPAAMMDAMNMPREDEVGRSLWQHIWGQMGAWMAIWTGVGLAYLLYVRKYFRTGTP